MNQDIFSELLQKSEIIAYRGLQDRILYNGKLIDSIESLVEKTILECASLVSNLVDQRIPASEYAEKIHNHFGVKNESRSS